MNKKSASIKSSSRRQFIKTSSAAIIGGALAPHLSFPQKAFAANSDTLRIGLIGCGGRGTGAAGQALAADKNVILTAMADAFEDRLQGSLKGIKQANPSQVQVDADHCFVGFDAYQRLLDSGVDVVILATPPGFRPDHLKAAVDAGKHIFTEKPMAVDAPGVRKALAAVEEAKKKKLALVSGFCWRYSLPERATFQQIHDGTAGDIRAVYATYNTSGLWCHPRKPEWSDMQWQMRNWYYFTWLSGDHIVEQAVHSIDKMAWAMKDAHPVRAVAHGGRQVRIEPQFGHIYDHFAVVYEYENGAKGFLFCRQQDNCANDNSDYILGTKGDCTISGFRRLHEIVGENSWNYTGPTNNMYQTEHDELFAAIRAAKPINDGAWMMNSTMMAVLGRMAAYTGKSITWEEALNSKEDLSPASCDWNQPAAVPPVAMPGKTKFI